MWASKMRSMEEKPHRGHRGRLGRFVRGYLMCVGTLTTMYVLIRLLVLLFVELGRWMSV